MTSTGCATSLPGREKLNEEVRKVWAEKFGIRILEGYGATECAPVLAVNTPMANSLGTVGPLLPGLEPRMEAALRILGRVKIFAEVAGEMVSPEVVERIAGHASPEHRHAATTQSIRSVARTSSSAPRTPASPAKLCKPPRMISAARNSSFRARLSR
jgi:hypothetical protein